MGPDDYRGRGKFPFEPPWQDPIEADTPSFAHFPCSEPFRSSSREGSPRILSHFARHIAVTRRSPNQRQRQHLLRARGPSHNVSHLALSDFVRSTAATADGTTASTPRPTCAALARRSVADSAAPRQSRHERLVFARRFVDRFEPLAAQYRRRQTRLAAVGCDGRRGTARVVARERARRQDDQDASG